MYAAAVLLLCVLPASLVRGLEITSSVRSSTGICVKQGSGIEHHIDTTASTFLQLIHNSTIFVDRTLLIKDLLEDPHPYVYISVPPKFGKSVNLDMVRLFLEMHVDKFGEPLPRFETPAFRFFKKGIWEGTPGNIVEYLPPLISQHNFLFDDYLSRYPIVYLDFSNFQATNYSEFKAAFAKVIVGEFQRHSYVASMLKKFDSIEATNEKIKFAELSNYTEKGHDLRLEHSIRFVTQVLSKVHHRAVFLMVDNVDFMHDIVLHSAFAPHEVKRVFEFLRYFFRVTFHQNMFLKKSIIFGTSRTTSIFLPFSSKSVVINHAVNNHFYPYFGVSENNFNTLSNHFSIDPQLHQKARNFYLGYTMSSHQSTPFYCIWSIVNYLNEKSVASHWLQISTTRFYLRNMMVVNEVRRSFERAMHADMILGTTYSTNHTLAIQKLQILRSIIQEPHHGNIGGTMYRVLMQYFCDYGFLTYNIRQSTKLQRSSHVSIPNEEISQNIRRDLEAYYREHLNIKPSSVGVLCERLDKFIMNEENDLKVLENHFDLLLDKLPLRVNRENVFLNHTRFNYTMVGCIMEFIALEMQFSHGYTARVFAVPGLKLRKNTHGAVLKINFYSNSTPEKILEASTTERWFGGVGITSIKVLALDINLENNTAKLFQGTVAPTSLTQVMQPQDEVTLPPAAPSDDGAPPPPQ